MGPDNGLCTAVAAQLVEVVERGLRPWQDNNVTVQDVVHIVGIEKMQAGGLLE